MENKCQCKGSPVTLVYGFGQCGIGTYLYCWLCDKVKLFILDIEFEQQVNKTPNICYEQ